MADMLVRLYDVVHDRALTTGLEADGVRVVRALAPDSRRVLRFVEGNAPDHWPAEPAESWLGECSAALSHHPPTCFLAVDGRSLVGFACYDATAKGYFGPTGVLRTHQRRGIGRALLLASLTAMWDDGYGYAIIGWPARDAIGFYEHTVGAEIIERSTPGIYRRLIDP